jgi:hypothetical protein
MESAVTVQTRREREAVPRGGSSFRRAVELALEAADADERVGPKIKATGIRMRLRFIDSGLVLDLAASEDPDRSIDWSFGGGVDWQPKLELAMEEAVANRYLQGRESLPIAIAQGKVRVRGGSDFALRYLPANRLLCEPYRRVVREQFPGLVADG